MQTFFVLGREPAISSAEIFKVIKRDMGYEPNVTSFSNELIVLDLKDDTDLSVLIKRLGGTIKIGKIINELPEKIESQKLIDVIIKTIKAAPSTKDVQKIRFGVSVYNGDGKNKNTSTVLGLQTKIKRVGMIIKKGLESGGLRARWVTSAEPILSSVIVKTNRLLREGAEIVIVADDKKIKVGYTVDVQPFEFLEKMDFGRPSREARVGMLPPKLAKMMVNISGADTNNTIIDPFCGSGTILTEAVLLGYTKIIGADIDPNSKTRTSQNLDWLEKSGLFPKTNAAKNIKLICSDIRKLTDHVEPFSVDAIVTELHLGPPLRGNETLETLEKIQTELAPLYIDAMKIFGEILQKNGTAVVVFPLLRYKNKFLETPVLNNLNSFGFKFSSLFPESVNTPTYLNSEFGRDGKTLIYGRPDQRVWREIAILKRQND